MNKSLPIIFFLSLLLTFTYGETNSIQNQDPADLTIPQLEDALDNYDHVIVLFEESEGTTLGQVHVEFLKGLIPLVQQKYPNTLVGKIVVEDTHNIPKYYKFDKYPALAYFYKGRKNTYLGSLDSESFMKWTVDTSVTTLVTLKGQDDFEQFMNSDNKPKLVAFYNSAAEDEKKVLNEIVEQDLLRHFDIHKVGLCLENCEITFKGFIFQKNSLALFRDYEGIEPVAVKKRGLDDQLDVLEFCNKEALPPVMDLDEVNITKLFAGYADVQMILFVDPQADNEQAIKDFEASALYNRKEDLYYERVLHSVFKFDEEWEEIKSFFQKYDRSKLPTVFITQITDDGISKFQYNKEKVDFNNLREFLDDFRKKNLDRMIISEELPNNEGKLFNKLVGNNFQKEVVNSKENYVVLFCDKPETQPCQTAYKLFDFVSLKLAETQPSNGTDIKLKFGHIDMIKNEVKYRSWARYPQVLLYMKGKKNRPNEFDLPFTPKAFAAWLNSMLPELELVLTDADEASFVQQNYSPEEKAHYDKMNEELLGHKQRLEAELKKAEEEEKEEPQPVLSLGGPSVEIPKPQETVKSEVKAESKTEVKKEKKDQPNVEL